PSLVWYSSSSAAAATGLYTLSLHDALPISAGRGGPVPCSPYHAHGVRGQSWNGKDDGCPLAGPHVPRAGRAEPRPPGGSGAGRPDRKSTRLNSSHVKISYAVFCLKKKTTHS